MVQDLLGPGLHVLVGPVIAFLPDVVGVIDNSATRSAGFRHRSAMGGAAAPITEGLTTSANPAFLPFNEHVFPLGDPLLSVHRLGAVDRAPAVRVRWLRGLLILRRLDRPSSTAAPSTAESPCTTGSPAVSSAPGSAVIADPMADGAPGPVDPVDPDPASTDVSGPVDKAQARPPNAAMPSAAAATTPLRSDMTSTILLKSILMPFPSSAPGPIPGRRHACPNGQASTQSRCRSSPTPSDEPARRAHRLTPR